MRAGAARRVLAAAICAAAAVASGGCLSSSAPPENLEFARIADLHALDGRYRNRGEGGVGEAPLFLSALVFPTDTALDHASVEALDVRAAGADTLVVRALDVRGLVVKQGSFGEGRDFALEAGRLRIRTRWALLSGVPDDPLVGPRMETVDLGLDVRGHGKSRCSFTAAGLVYLVVPVFFHDASEARFERLED